MTYNFTNLITALDTKAQAIAADANTTAKDLIYLGKAIEAINDVAGTPLRSAENLSDVADVAIARTNLGLPHIDITGITQDQILTWNATLNKFVAGGISAGATTSTSDPTGSESDVSAGDFFVNTASGEIFVALTASPSPQWAGTLGNSVNIPQGQEIYFTTRTSSQGSNYYDNTFTVPTDVTKIHVVLVGGGGAGGPSWSQSAGSGGGLAYKNNISVTPGETYTLRVGNGGWNTNNGYDTELRTSTGTVIFKAAGGKYNGTTVSNTYDQGFSKPVAGTLTPDNISVGKGGLCSQNGYGGGGGAGGYTGNGGNGTYGNTLSNVGAGSGSKDGTGGGGGGGGGYGSSTYGFGGGGGVGLFGEGSSGLGGNQDNGNSFYSDGRYGGKGGSGGENGADNSNSSQSIGYFGSTSNTDASMNTATGSGQGTGSRTMYSGVGGMMGGGGAGSGTSLTGNAYFCSGGPGGARVIWGYGRSFPKTRTGNQS